MVHFVRQRRGGPRLSQPLGQFLDFRLGRFKLGDRERLDRRAGRIGAIADVVVLPAFVTGHLATLGVGNRKIKVPALAQFGGDGARAARGACRPAGRPWGLPGREFPCRQDRCGACRPDWATRCGRSRRAVHVGHDIFLAAVAVFDPQVIAAIVVGKPRLRVGGRGRSPIVGGELPGHVGRIGELGHRRQVRHVVQKAGHGVLRRQDSAGKNHDQGQHREAEPQSGPADVAVIARTNDFSQIAGRHDQVSKR